MARKRYEPEEIVAKLRLSDEACRSVSVPARREDAQPHFAAQFVVAPFHSHPLLLTRCGRWRAPPSRQGRGRGRAFSSWHVPIRGHLATAGRRVCQSANQFVLRSIRSAPSRVDNTAVAEFYRLEPKLAGCVPTLVCIKGHTVTILAIFKTLFKCPNVLRARISFLYCGDNFWISWSTATYTLFAA
jgi:hypothetical protein